MANGHTQDAAKPGLGFSDTVLDVSRSLRGLPSFLRTPVVLISKVVARVRPRVWMAYDGVVAGLALVLGYILTPRGVGLSPSALEIGVFAGSIAAAGNVMRLYERELLRSRIRMVLAVAVTVGVALAVLALFSNIIMYEQIGRWVMILTSTMFLLGALTPRLIAHYAANTYKIRVLLVGDSQDYSSLARRFCMQSSQHQLMVACGGKSAGGDSCSWEIEDIPGLVKQLQIDEILIANGYINRADVLEKCMEAMRSGCRVMDEASFYEQVFEEVPVDRISEGWFYTATLCGASPFDVALKRVFDVVVASAGLVLLAPVFVSVWMLIRLTSPGPAIYSQRRCGLNGDSFLIHKFRTMHCDAESKGPQWAVDCDPRVTSLGRVLRKTRLDELPQFWNVLRGEMSFVGPRPERPEFVEQIERAVPFYAVRHLVRPGITGLAQIRYKYGASVEDARRKLQHDLYYIKNWSPLLDLLIGLRTVSALMKGSR